MVRLLPLIKARSGPRATLSGTARRQSATWPPMHVHLSAAMRTVPQVHCDVGSTHMPPMPTTTEPSGRKVTCHVSTGHSDCNTVTRENVTAPSVKSHAVMRDVTASRTALTSSHSTSVGGARSSSRLSQGTCARARCVRAINPVRVRTAAEAAISRQGSWRPPWGHDRLVVTRNQGLDHGLRPARGPGRRPRTRRALARGPRWRGE